jgi:glycerophosphoryl diester phosphodiesterase
MRIFFCVLAAWAAASGAAAAAEPSRPLIIGHRGASGYLPEHTREAYVLAAEQGADFIEPDLVVTKDGVLIARHENELSDTTDVAEKFPARKTVKTIDGRQVEGWFAEDFTLAEIKTLRARERVSLRSRANDGKFPVPTFAEVLSLRADLSKRLGREIGVYPETKHPTYFRGLGLALEERVVGALAAAGLDRADAPVILQSFEPDSIRRFAQLTPVRRVQLLGDLDERPYDPVAAGAAVTYADLASDAGLREIARYAQGIGPSKRLIVPAGQDGRLGPATDLVARAQAAGLFVHPYTFRPEPQFLAADYGGDARREVCAFAALGVDGLFTDTPDVALKAFTESCPIPARR